MSPAVPLVVALALLAPAKSARFQRHTSLLSADHRHTHQPNNHPRHRAPSPSRARSRALVAAAQRPDASGDFERELARYRTRRFRIVQSAPLRLLTRTLDDARSSAAALTRFYSDFLAAVPFTPTMLGLTCAAFAVQQACGQAAMMAGARMNGLIFAGQWYRLITPVFLHGSVGHLLSNCYSLYNVGPITEQFFGVERSLLIFILSGIGGNVLGLYLGDPRGLSVGASGAVFGLMGCVFAFAMRNKREMGYAASSIQQQLTRVLAINLIFGMQRGSGVDNLAHVGGFVSGALFGTVLAPEVRRRGSGENVRGGLVPAAAVRIATIVALAASAASVRSAWTVGSVLMRRSGAAARLLR